MILILFIIQSEFFKIAFWFMWFQFIIIYDINLFRLTIVFVLHMSSFITIQYRGLGDELKDLSRSFNILLMIIFLILIVIQIKSYIMKVWLVQQFFFIKSKSLHFEINQKKIFYRLFTMSIYWVNFKNEQIRYHIK